MNPNQPHEDNHHDKDNLPDVLVKILSILGAEFIHPRHHEKPRYISAKDDRYPGDERNALCPKGRRVDQNEGGKDEHDKYGSTLRRDYPCAVGEVYGIAFHNRLEAGKMQERCYNIRSEYVEKSEIFFFPKIPDDEVGADCRTAKQQTHLEDLYIPQGGFLSVLWLR